MKRLPFSFFLIFGLLWFTKPVYAQLHQWSFALGKSQLTRPMDIETDAQGNVIVTGILSDSLDLDPGAGVHAVPGAAGAFLAKYNAQGQFIWGYSYENYATGFITPMEIAIHSNGEILVCGFITNDSVDLDFGSGIHRVPGNIQTGFVAKYNANGQYMWGFSLYNPNADPFYASSIIRDIETGPDGSFYISGSFHSSIDFDPGSGTSYLNSMDHHDLFLAKYNVAGQLIWKQQIGGGGGDEHAHTLHLDDSSHLYIGGSFYGVLDVDPGPATFTQGFGFVNTGFFCQYDTAGQFQWSKVFKPSNNGINNNTIDITTDQSGNVYVTGNFHQNTDFDPYGMNVVMTSNSVSTFLLKYQSSGQYVWGFPIEGSAFGVLPSEIAITPALPLPPIVPGNIQVLVLTGTMGGPVDFAPGAGQFIIPAKGNQDAFVALYTTDSIPICAYSIAANSPNFQMGRGVSTLSNGNFVVTGEFGQGSADVDPIFGNQILQSQGFTDAYVVKYALDTLGYCAFGLPTGIEAPSVSSLSLHPNPAHQSVTLSFPSKSPCKILIYNTFGQQVMETTLRNGESVDTGGWTSGVYYVIVNDDKASYSCRLLKN